MRRNNTKRIVSFLLMLVMLIGLLPTDITVADVLQEPIDAVTIVQDGEPNEPSEPANDVTEEIDGLLSEQPADPAANGEPEEPQLGSLSTTPAANNNGADELLSVTITKIPPIIKELQLYYYADKDDVDATPIGSGKSITASLAPGDYWVNGIALTGGTSVGGIKITVDAEHTEFQICAAMITISNSGWVKDADYNLSVEVKNQDNTATREVEIGVSGKSPSVLALYNDVVSATVEPSEDKKAEGYQETTGQTNPLTGLEQLKITCQSGISVTFQVPEEAELLVGQQSGYYTYTYETPTESSDTSATYLLRENTTYFYRVSHPDGVTYWKFDKWTGNTNTVTVSEDDLFINSDAFTKSTVIRDFSSNRADVGGIYLNINEKNYLPLNKEDSYTLNVSRSWQAIEGISNRETALPDMHYTVINPETGNTSNVVTVEPDANNSSVATLTAKEQGTAIVLVTYDAMSYPGAYYAQNGDPKFSAIWPENTGVFVVTVDEDGSQIETNMTINEGYNDTTVEKVAGDKLDGELDVLYYLEDTDGASYTFTPESGCEVTLLHPTLTDEKMTYAGGFSDEDVSVDPETGAVTVSGLTEGRHIVKVTKDGVSTYQVITAKPTTMTITNQTTGEEITEDTPVKPGDEIKVQYSGLFDPAGKLAGIYNFATVVYMESQNGDKFPNTKPSGGMGIYLFPSATAMQARTFTVPLYWNSDTIELKACLRVSAYGSPLGTHRELDYSLGRNPDFNAPSHETYMGSLPSVTLKVDYDKNMPYNQIQPMDGDTPIENFTILNLQDEEGNAVHPTGGTFQAGAGTYTFAIQAPGYLYYEGSITVTADGKNVFEISMTKLGADPWDGSTLTKPQQDEDGTYLIGTGAELAWFVDYLSDSKNDDRVNAVLTDDIELAGYPFCNDGSMLGGVFDGQGYSINNLYVERDTHGPCGGLFDYVLGYGTDENGIDHNGIVKNVTVNGRMEVNATVNGSVVSNQSLQVGGIAGYVMWGANKNEIGEDRTTRYCAVINCVSNVDITVNVTDQSAREIAIGGIAGWANGGGGTSGQQNIGRVEIKDCVNLGDIQFNVTGFGSQTTHYIGGIAGSTGVGCQTTNVTNHGDISVHSSVQELESASSASVGGVIGYANIGRTLTDEGGTDTATILQGLWNDGAVSVVHTESSELEDVFKIGGIVGNWFTGSSQSEKTFEDAYNSGEITVNAGGELSCMGGIIGYINLSKGESFEASNLYTTVGTVLGKTRYEAGEDYTYTFTNSYYQADEESGFGAKLDLSALNLTGETVEETDKENLQNLYNAFSIIPEEAWTEEISENFTTVQKLLSVLGETVNINVSVYDYTAKNAGLEGASASGIVANYIEQEIPMGSTAAEALKAVFDTQGLEYTMEETAYGSYLSSVGSLAASGNGGWMLAFNDDQFDNLGLDAITVGEGDTLQLHYSVDGGTDIGAASAGLPILTSLTLSGNTVTMEKKTDWSTGAAMTTYYITSGQGKTKITGTGSKNDPFVINVAVPKGTDLTDMAVDYTTCLDKDYATVTGLETKDFSKDVFVSLNSLTGATAYYVVKTTEKSTGGTTHPGGDEKINVTFRLIGSTKASDVDLSKGEEGYNGAEYVTWIPTKSYRLDEISTVGDLFAMALDDAGLSYQGLNNNYISSITAPSVLGGFQLEEFTNGEYSGWMYTVNGEHPAFGLNSYLLEDGDEVVWHYVNDYRYEVEDWFDGSMGTEELWNRWLGAKDVVPSSEHGSGNGGNTGITVPSTTDPTTPGQDVNPLPFTDISEHWASDVIAFAYEKGLMTGVSNTEFDPDGILSRGMLVTVLYRMAGEPETTAESVFTDVAEDTWYTKAVLWASEHGIVSGYGDGRFGPDDAITREQLTTIFYRYTGAPEISGTELDAFVDAGSISDYAQPAMLWAVQNDIINGKGDGMIDPIGNATRAETAAIFQRYLENAAQ